jgi:hypothetical protein
MIPEWYRIDASIERGGDPKPGFISRRAAAKQLGVSPPVLTDLHNGTKAAGPKLERAIAKARYKGRLDLLEAEAEAWCAAHPEAQPQEEPGPPQPTIAPLPEEGLHPLDAVLEEPRWVADAGLTFEQAQMVVGDLQALRTKATVPLPRSAWRDERDRAVNRALGRDARVHRREPVTPPFDPDAPSPELLELKAKRAAEKAKRAAEKAKRAAEKAEREPAAKANRAKKR